jgi:hypothetical protein
MIAQGDEAGFLDMYHSAQNFTMSVLNVNRVQEDAPACKKKHHA